MLDITTILVIFVGGLLAIGITAYMLNRAWGDFPRRASPTARGPASTPLSSPPARASAPADTDASEQAEPPLPAGAPEDSLIPITNPTVRTAVERALERGGTPYATYFLRDGDRIYLAAYRIADPIQRAQLVRMFRGLDSGDLSGVNFGEIISAIQRLGT